MVVPVIKERPVVSPIAKETAEDPKRDAENNVMSMVVLVAGGEQASSHKLLRFELTESTIMAQAMRPAPMSGATTAICFHVLVCVYE